MTFNLLVSQGRAADKTQLTIKGAAFAAQALHERFGTLPRYLGEPSPPAQDDWTESLLQARPTLEAVADALENSIQSGKMTVLVSNTCSISLASLPVMARHYPQALLLWIDAHGDFNTPDTTQSGYLGGMVVAAACGLWDSGHGAGQDPQNVLFVGARDLDAEEELLIRRSGAQIITTAQVTPEELRLAVGARKVWIHIDWDVLEPGFVPADYEVPGGLLPAQIRAMLQALPREQIIGIELSEYQAPADPAQRTSSIATIVDIVEPLLSGGLSPASSPRRLPLKELRT